MYTDLKYGKEARQGLVNGVNKLVRAVKSTLGGNGKNVIITDKLSNPHATKDGVTVAKSIFLSDDLEQAGVEIIRQASIKAADETGDGTTTATVLAGSMINQGMDLKKTNIQYLRDGMEYATELICDKLSETTEDIKHDKDTIVNVATISANGDRKIGEIVGTSIFDTGVDGHFSVDRDSSHSNSGLSFERKEGYAFNKEFPIHFETVKGSGKCVLDNPKVIIINYYLGQLELLEHIIDYNLDNKTPIVVFYKDIQQTVLTTVMQNYLTGKLNMVLCQLPDYGELQELSVQDIATGTGASIITNPNKEKPKVSHFGEMKRFEAKGGEVRLIFSEKEEIKNAINEKVENIKVMLEEASEDNKYLYDVRFKRLSEGVGIFKIGVQTEIEYLELKDKVDDAIGSVLSAMKEGITTGGGVSLVRVADSVKDLKFQNKSYQTGFDIVIKACYEPFIQILNNCEVTKYKKILKQIRASNYELGYDARHKEIANIKSRGIIDATRVVKVSLKSATSVAIAILTTDCVMFPEKL